MVTPRKKQSFGNLSPELIDASVHSAMAESGTKSEDTINNMAIEGETKNDNEE